jgi:hypothetical protein
MYLELRCSNAIDRHELNVKHELRVGRNQTATDITILKVKKKEEENNNFEFEKIRIVFLTSTKNSHSV